MLLLTHLMFLLFKAMINRMRFWWIRTSMWRCEGLETPRLRSAAVCSCPCSCSLPHTNTRTCL